MDFPLQFDVLNENGNKFTMLSFYNGVLTLIGQNGSGKTQLLRKIKKSIPSLIEEGKKVRYLSAGRIGVFEQYRSDYNGYSGIPQYDEAQFGSKADLDRRHNFETINGDFQTLSIRSDILIKVKERLKKLFNRDLFIEWGANGLKADFKRNDIDSTTYSAAREASGLIQLVAILAAIYDDEVGALLIDEPEVSLHPQLQSFLQKEIEKYAGDTQQNKKLIVLATHSTEFIKVSSSKDLCNIVFCYDLEKPPIQLTPDVDELQNKKINALLLRIGHEHKLAFFSMRPLLVEGLSDAIICHGIERKLDMFVEAAGVQIVPIIGKGDFPVVYKLFKLIGKEPIILADGDAFTDSVEIPLLFSDSCIAKDMAIKNGASSFNAFVKTIHNDFCKIADSQTTQHKNLLENTLYWKTKKSNDDCTKIYRRAFFSLIYTDTTPDFLLQEEQVKNIKTRINSLFEVLNSAGCFILKKGTIESYYVHSDSEISCDKPNIAVEEVDLLNDQENSLVINQYSDVIHCLNYAAKTKGINEVETLKELLVAILGPILLSLGQDTNQSGIQSTIRNILSDRGELFEIKLDSTNKNKISVNVKSRILEVNCFPFEIEKSDNLLQIIDTKLGLNGTNKQ